MDPIIISYVFLGIFAIVIAVTPLMCWIALGRIEKKTESSAQDMIIELKMLKHELQKIREKEASL